jgi:hypothetical protein
VAATGGNASATVTWTAPVDNGGFAIDFYTVTATPGGQTATTPDGTTLSATVGGLTNGTSYTFTVTAHNVEPSVGDPSESSNPVTPATVPGAPAIGTATPGQGQATVSWSAPAANGSPITGYTVTSTPGGFTATVNGTTLSATVAGLTNGTSYTFTVHATNGAGSGPESAPSNAVSPAATVPGAPTGVAASPGNASAIITWSAPADTGGSAVLSYTVTTSGPGAVPSPVTVGGSTTAVAVNGLTNGVAYTFTVTATNVAGDGPASTPSAAVVPGTVPGAPTGVSASPGDGSVTVTWLAPAGQGGSALISFTVTTSGPGVVPSVTVAAPASTATVGGLTNGVAYTFKVKATNSAGSGPASASVGPVIPAADVPVTTASIRSGYWMVGSDGQVYPFGDAAFLGDPKSVLGTAQAVDLEPTPSGNGYRVVDNLGRVYAYGDAIPVLNGNLAGLGAGERVTSLSATPSGAGYWIFTTRGRAVTFGDAGFYGDMSAVTLNGPVRDSIPTPSGKGYYMVASDGGIFAFGDAAFYGSMGGIRLNAPVQSLVPDADGVGYWLVAADGGIFAFDAPYRGSMGDTVLNKPVTGMVRFGNGYLMVGTDGGIFSFSDRKFEGSLGATPPIHPIVSVAVLAA